MKPQNFEENLVWYSILGTFVLYFIGAQFIWFPLLALILTVYLLKRLWVQTEDTPAEERVSVPIGAWVWIAGALVLELAVIMGNLDQGLGTFKLMGATVAWWRSWALMALFVLAGGLRIRSKLLFRAACIFCIQCLFFTLLAHGLHLIGRNITYQTFWPSIVGGDPQPYAVNLYVIDWDEGGRFRLHLFTPFANTLGVVGALYFFLCSQEANKLLRFVGMFSAALMVIDSASRAPTMGLILVPLATWLMTLFTRPTLQLLAGAVSFVAGILSGPIIEMVDDFWERTFTGYRASSAIIRQRLQDVALERWADAPIWGHAVIEAKGPKYTAEMPIGTHHTWFGLLYGSGAVGFAAFAVMSAWTFVELFIKAQTSHLARTAMNIFLTLMLATLSINIEGSAYFYGPSLILLGIALKEQVPNFWGAKPFALASSSQSSYESQ